MDQNTLLKSRLENMFERLEDDKNWEITSPFDVNYNCIAWAVKTTKANIWPIEYGICQTIDGGLNAWFEEFPLDEKLETFVHLFNKYSFRICDLDWSLENGFEKLALYSNDGINMSHVARQLTTGMWTSKIGKSNDITHSSPIYLEGISYGKAVIAMKRLIK